MNAELTVGDIVGMSAQQLAESSIKSQRERNSSALFDAHRGTSIEEALEQRRRQVMDNQTEVWRNKGDNRQDQTQADVTQIDPMHIETVQLSRNESRDSSDGASPRSSSSAFRPHSAGMEIEDDAAAAAAAKSIDVDAGSRFVSAGKKPYRSPHLEALSGDVEPVQVARTVAIPSPRAKAPNLLELLRSNSGHINDGKTDTAALSAATAANASHGSVSVSTLPRVPLLTSTGTRSGNKLKLVIKRLARMSDE